MAQTKKFSHSCPRRVSASNETNTQNASSMKTDWNYSYGCIKVTYAKLSPNTSNPNDLAKSAEEEEKEEDSLDNDPAKEIKLK